MGQCKYATTFLLMVLSTPGLKEIACLVLLLIILFCLQKEKNDQLLLDPNYDTRENVMYYNEEGAGEEDMHAFDLSRLQKPVDPDHAVMSAAQPNSYSTSTSRDMAHLVTAGSSSMSAANMASSNMNEAGGMSAGGMSAGQDNAAFNMSESDAHGGGAMSGGSGGMMTRSSMSVTRRQYTSSGQGGVNVFIDDRLYDADNDPNMPPFDSVREYEYEGGGSSAGSLSTIQTSSSGDLDFNYLSDYGPQFQKLADMYGYEQDGEGDNV